MNSPRFQDLQQAYAVGQLESVRAGFVRADSAGPEVHATLNRLLWVTGGMLFAALNFTASVGLLFF
jgi:hypothetical protein